MNQQTNQGANNASPAEAQVKRKRGRPRKDESQAHSAEKSRLVLNQPPLRPMVTRMMLGEASSAAKPAPNIPSKGKDHMEVDIDSVTADDDNDHNNDEMVGQVVTGVLECAFDAGYFLRVRVADTNVHMRGVVFREGCVVPVTPENDIAPHAKMYRRKDIPIPVTFSPQVLPRPTVNSSSQPIDSSEDQQKQPPLVRTVPQKENYSALPQGFSEQQGNSTIHLNTEQHKLAVEKDATVSDQEQITTSKEPIVADAGDKEKETELTESVENVESSSKAVKEDVYNLNEKQEPPRMEGLEESSEPQMKLQKTDQTTMGYSNGLSHKDVSSSDVNYEEGAPESIAKVVEATTTILLEETTIPSETTFATNEPTILPRVVEPEIGGASSFQISMENTDNDDPDPLCEPNEASPMRTE